ncbi:MAG: flagellar protein [Blastomonas sp.]
MTISTDLNRIAMAAGGMALAVLFAAGTAPANAQSDFQDLAELDVQVAAAMGAEIGEPGGARAKIDRRLKLKSCPAPVIVEAAEPGTAAVRCKPIGWRIRVPLVPSSTARSTGGYQRSEQAVAEEGVKRGEPILLTVERPSFTLSRVMVADRDGKVGEVIPVREDPKGKPIFVRIVEPGKATILGN